MSIRWPLVFCALATAASFQGAAGSGYAGPMPHPHRRRAVHSGLGPASGHIVPLYARHPAGAVAPRQYPRWARESVTPAPRTGGRNPSVDPDFSDSFFDADDSDDDGGDYDDGSDDSSSSFSGGAADTADGPNQATDSDSSDPNAITDEDDASYQSDSDTPSSYSGSPQASADADTDPEPSDQSDDSDPVISSDNNPTDSSSNPQSTRYRRDLGSSAPFLGGANTLNPLLQGAASRNNGPNSPAVDEKSKKKPCSCGCANCTCTCGNCGVRPAITTAMERTAVDADMQLDIIIHKVTKLELEHEKKFTHIQ
ncbi:hypothetical protein H4R33_003145 [Dimargaris cristalligena]|nr:hypothetical protein H4R33_003145 [Dimargaris cristalligena]